MKKQVPKYSTVMLIDDSEVDNFINQKMIEGCNISRQIHIYGSGHSALDSLKNMERASKAGNCLKPDIIFLDINMPIMDGFQFVEEFEKLSKQFIKGIKIIILTSSINPADEARSKKYNNISDYIIKPLNQTTLTAI